MIMPASFRPILLFAVPLVLLSRPAFADEDQINEHLTRSRTKYNTPAKWAARREELREEFLKGAKLWPLPERPPVKAIRHSLREYDGYSVENVAIETLPDFYCTGNLYRPLGRKDLGPAILCPHGHFRPLGRYRENHQIRCAHFARMGATVFSYSMVGWQDSRQTTHDDPLVLALQTWNSVRVVDFLSGLQRVDRARIGVTGASGGGTQTFFLSLVDRRVKVSAPLVIVYPWAAPQGCLCEGGLPVMQAANTNAIELAAATSPRPQLLISVGNDPTENFPNVGFPFIKKMYGVADAAESVKNVHFADEGHDFGPSKRKLVYEFFARHLRMERNRFVAPGESDRKIEMLPEDVTKIKIETPEQMQVFDAKHLLPARALKGSEAIAATFERHLTALRGKHAANAIRVPDGPLTEYSFRAAGADDETLLFTPPGFEQVGVPKVAAGPTTGKLMLSVRDRETSKPTFCRVNVIGPDGNYYEPKKNKLKAYSLTGVWPKAGWGNRPGKAPIRYLGRFFYCDGLDSINVPPGKIRIEVWKGFEYRPIALTTFVRAGRTRTIELTLDKTASMKEHNYWSGDPHIHIQRHDEADEQRILDLLEAEDIHFGTVLAYNEPAGSYAGFMKRMDSPQFRGLGTRSILSRGDYHILSGQEYRSRSYGHLNLFLLDELVMSGESVNANNWPPYGHVAEQARELGGIAFYAHGGYAQEVYADVVQGNVDGVELLQFGVYRGIGLTDWYRMLNAGFRVPASGACDYPACRKLGDCKTYAYLDPGSRLFRKRRPPRRKEATSAYDRTVEPYMEEWLSSMRGGKSFFTSGPLLLLQVDGKRPGSRIERHGHTSRVTANLRVRSEVAPVTNVQLIANGRVVREMEVPAGAGQGEWIELEETIELTESAWIAARAFSLSSLGTPDAESHTNPVYIYLNGRAPYDRDSLDELVAAIDKQIAAHKERKFAEQAKVIAYFERSRDILMQVRAAGGAPSSGHPSDLANALTTINDPGSRVHTEEELREFLKPQPAKPIEEVLHSFDAVDGFEMQLVAREPLVNDPIAAAFDENGNLYVCEMRDYPYKPQPGDEPIGTLRLLKDTDGDGTFDESHVFADRLLWAGGVAPWKGGVFVAAPPDIWYMKDTDGDNQADVRRRVYTGFGTGNQQAMLNNLHWGLDHKIYGSTAGNGGNISYIDNPHGWPEPISVSGRDFRFDPATGKFEAVTGTVQFGNAFDDWGNRFLCSESRPLLNAVLPQHYLERNPHLPVPSSIHNLTPGPVPIFRISPLERWRMIRSSRRVATGARSPNASGASHHVIDAAAGVTIYRGGAYPKEYYGNVFIGGAQNNVIHRRVLTPDGVTFASKRADEGTEFLRSSDNWFRPVNFINAPDGTLYVLDMSREILETIHVPLDVTKFLDFKSGRIHGRIYRIAPPDFESPGSPQLGTAKTEELVSALASPHGWYRDTAHRLIQQRQDRSAIAHLRRMLDHESPQARLHALWSLRGLDAISEDDLALALGDSHMAVREHAMRLAEPSLDKSPKLLKKVVAFADDANPRLRFQAAFSLGEATDAQAAQALSKLAKESASDRWIRTAVLSSSSKQADRMLIDLLEDSTFATSSAGTKLLEELGTVVGAQARPAAANRVLDALATHPTARKHASLATRILLTVGSGLKRNGRRLISNDTQTKAARAFLQRAFAAAQETAASSEATQSSRIQGIKLLSCAPFGQSRETLTGLHDVQQPEPVQIEAIRALADYSHQDIGTLLLTGWKQHSPTVRKEVVQALLARPERTRLLLEAAAQGEASVAQVDSTRRALLLKDADESTRSLAEKLFGQAAAGSRNEVIGAYQAALKLKGQQTRGEKVFQQECAACHKLGTSGHAIGPNLASSPARDPRALLAHILAPNQYLLPNYESYVVVDTNGRVYTGMLASQTATSITLKREENKTDTILRGNIDEMASTGKSLMPEGLEKKIDKQAMADLIAFLQAASKPTGPQPLPIGTLPGLIEPSTDTN
jgi:putative membrane-bound dehydrogenase-like protein